MTSPGKSSSCSQNHFAVQVKQIRRENPSLSNSSLYSGTHSNRCLFTYMLFVPNTGCELFVCLCHVYEAFLTFLAILHVGSGVARSLLLGRQSASAASTNFFGARP